MCRCYVQFQFFYESQKAPTREACVRLIEVNSPYNRHLRMVLSLHLDASARQQSVVVEHYGTGYGVSQYEMGVVIVSGTQCLKEGENVVNMKLQLYGFAPNLQRLGPIEKPRS